MAKPGTIYYKFDILCHIAKYPTKWKEEVFEFTYRTIKEEEEIFRKSHGRDGNSIKKRAARKAKDKK